MTKLHKYTLAILAGLALTMVIGVLYIHSTDERGKHLVTWNVYSGTLTTPSASRGYNVEISESDRGFGFVRILHLWPVGRPGFEGITGHDYDNDGQWDRVFYCGSLHPNKDGKSGGCNSVLRTRSGWRFEPCDADKGNIDPFSPAQISFAISELDIAMRELHNREHLVSQWKWNSQKKTSEQVFKKS